MFLIEGSVITIDGMGCQKKTASKIRGKKAVYVLALKGNQKNLYNEAIDLFEKPNTPEFKKLQSRSGKKVFEQNLAGDQAKSQRYKGKIKSSFVCHGKPKHY